MALATQGGRLRRRIAVALVGLSIATASLLGIGNWAVERWVEDDSLNRLLDGEIEHRIALQSPLTPDSAATTLRYFRPNMGASGAPAVLLQLAPGTYDRVLIDDHPYRARVREVTPGDRAYLLFDLAPLEAREGRLILAFGAGVALLALVAWWLSSRLAERVLAPLDTLVKQIRALDPEARGARLEVADTNELGVIAQAVNGYVQRLDALVERERAFSAAASHELRTPLAVIGGAAEILAARPADSERALGRIGRAVEQARHDLDALLALSRVKEHLPTSSLALHECLPRWAEAHVAASAASVIWNLKPVTLAAPAGSVSIIFTNLLRNGLRAAGTHGKVEILLEPGRLVLRDDGPGIPEAELPLVFEPGFRGRDGGTGIGLYVAQTLALRQGWKLSLANCSGARGAKAQLLFQEDLLT